MHNCIILLLFEGARILLRRTVPFHLPNVHITPQVQYRRMLKQLLPGCILTMQIMQKKEFPNHSLLWPFRNQKPLQDVTWPKSSDMEPNAVTIYISILLKQKGETILKPISFAPVSL